MVMANEELVVNTEDQEKSFQTNLYKRDRPASDKRFPHKRRRVEREGPYAWRSAGCAARQSVMGGSKLVEPAAIRACAIVR